MSPDGTIIENSTVSDATLERLVNQFGPEEQKILFALYAQFNSTLDAQYCRPVVELVFNFLCQNDRELWFKGLRRSLEAMTPRSRTVVSILLNNPEARQAKEDAEREDKELTALIDAMVGRASQLLVSPSKKVLSRHADLRKDEMCPGDSHSSRTGS